MGKQVELVYYKDSGKYYTQDIYFSDWTFDFDIFSEVRLKAKNKWLPGLESGSWTGYILVKPLDGVTALIDLTGETK